MELEVSPKLCLVKVVASNWEDVLCRMHVAMLHEGVVKDSFLKAVVEREKVFPTGLETAQVCVAIPHADAEHCVRTAVAVATLASPVPFRSMAAPDVELPVEVVFALSVPKPDEQVAWLQRLCAALSQEDFLHDLVRSCSPEELADHLRSALLLRPSIRETCSGSMDQRQEPSVGCSGGGA